MNQHKRLPETMATEGIIGHSQTQNSLENEEFSKEHEAMDNTSGEMLLPTEEKERKSTICY